MNWEDMTPDELLNDLDKRAEAIKYYSRKIISLIPKDKCTWMAHDDPTTNILILSNHVVNIGRELRSRVISQGDFTF